MYAFVTHLMGNMEPLERPDQQLAALAAELDGADHEHGSVSVTNADEWCLSLHREGRMILESLTSQREGPRHSSRVDTSRAIQLWRSLADGDMASVLKHGWLPGHGS